MASRLTSGTTSGTSGSMRKWEVLSITTAPALAARGECSAETLPPGEDSTGSQTQAIQAAAMAAYNRWLETFCAAHPERLIGLAQCAVKTPEEGIRELEAIKRQGFRGVMLPGLPGCEADYCDRAFTEFFDALVELGVFNEVTTFTTSDFGRTLTSNGKGSDHGWGGHQMVMGGPVAGGHRRGARQRAVRR